MIPNFCNLLQILNVNLNSINLITQPVKFRYVIFPDESFGADDKQRGKIFFTNEYLETVNRVKNYALKNFSPISIQKFYFFHGKNQIGEERITQYLQSKGYGILRPELLPLEEQLNILINCKEFVSTLGSVSHNIIFMKDGSNVALIPRFGMNGYQSALNQVNNLNIFYINSSLSIFRQTNNFADLGPLCYIVSENLRKHFGDKITEKYTDEDFVTFLVYLRYAKSRGLKENPYELAYLKNILPEFMAQLMTRKDLLKKFGITIQ